MKRGWIIILLLLAIISKGCKGDKENANSKTIHLTNSVYQLNYKKIREIKLESLLGVIFANISSERCIYTAFAAPDKNYGIRKYDLNLKEIEEFEIPYGQGPDECLSMIILGGNEEKILIFDNSAQKYYLYNGDFSSRSKIESRLLGSFVNHGYNYFPSIKTAVVAFWEKTAHSRADYDVYTLKVAGKKIENRVIFKGHFEGFKRNGLLNWGEPYDFKVIGDYIYLLELDKYRFLKMDLTGKIIQTVSVKNWPHKRFSRRQLEKWVQEAGFDRRLTFPEKLWPACWMIRIKDGFAVGRRENYDTMKEGDWIDADYFDLDLDYRGKIKVPWVNRWRDPRLGQEAVESKFFFRRNHLFIIETREAGDDEDYFLIKWEIK